jgi:gliding motility-associated-like protein
MPAMSTQLVLLVFQLLFVISIYAQPVPESDCSNGIDDNHNGLTDRDDSHCYFYFDSLDYEVCEPTPILWASSDLGVHWINLATDEERLIPPPADGGEYIVDIAWLPSGKLYAATDRSNLFEVDPLTGAYTSVGKLSRYQPNGMTADAAGTLYLTAYFGQDVCDLIKINTATGEIELIVHLSDYGLFASGDCSFLNGWLYISCANYIAKVDVKTKAIEKIPVSNIVNDDSWGLTTLGDGYLYITDNGPGIYRMDPETMELKLVAKFHQSGMATSGFASYVDACHAPCVKPFVSLGPDTVVCTNSTLLLNAETDRTVSSFVWSNGTNQKINTITSPGTYWLQVSNICETSSDTVVVAAAEKPLVALQNDALICNFSSIVLQNLQPSQPRDRWIWQDNSTQTTFTVTMPGTYWLQASNICGVSADTVKISPQIDSCECFVFIPNAFSPNNDHANDVFQVSSRCLLKGSIQIFNRWGQLVYKSDNLDEGWNGMFADQLQPEDTYVYSIQFTYLDQPGVFSRKGAVILLR